VDVQLAAVRLDAGAEGPLVEQPQVVGDGAHSACDGGRPESSSPGAMQRLEERCRNRGCFIAQSSTARPSGASAQRHHHGPSVAGQAVRSTAAAALTRRSDSPRRALVQRRAGRPLPFAHCDSGLASVGTLAARPFRSSGPRVARHSQPGEGGRIDSRPFVEAVGCVKRRRGRARATGRITGERWRLVSSGLGG
jgi:hypothetical protein